MRIGLGQSLGGILVVLAALGLYGCDPDPPQPPEPTEDIREVGVFHYNLEQGRTNGVIDEVIGQIEQQRPGSKAWRCSPSMPIPALPPP